MQELGASGHSLLAPFPYKAVFYPSPEMLMDLDLQELRQLHGVVYLEYRGTLLYHLTRMMSQQSSRLHLRGEFHLQIEVAAKNGKRKKITIVTDM